MKTPGKRLSQKDQNALVYFLSSRSSQLQKAINEKDWNKVQAIQEQMDQRQKQLIKDTECW